MKTLDEINVLAEKAYPIKNDVCRGLWSENFAYKLGYFQCQEDMAYTKGCECESSIGQTWCCNQCGLPYDTRKSDNKYTEEDMKKAFKFYAYAHISQQPHSYEKLEQDYLQFIQSLNKQI